MVDNFGSDNLKRLLILHLRSQSGRACGRRHPHAQHFARRRALGDRDVDVTAVGEAHVDHAAELWDQGREGGLPKETKYVIPGLWFMQAYLEALEKADFDPTVVGGGATRSPGALWKLARLAL